VVALGVSRRAPATDINHIAVLPFTVRGPGDYAYLSQGIVTLLSAGLDGAGATTVVDPQAVLSYVDQRRENALDVSEGRQMAAQFGAGSFVVGDIVATGRALQITARLYTGDGRQAALASVVAQRETDILAVVDTLARTILSQRIKSPAQRLARVGLLATPSFAAAKAYLDGETHYRNGRYEQAFDAYRRAVALDSTFAIAHYRLATVADWVNMTEVISPSLRRAVKYSERADAHERRLIQALSLFWFARTLDADTAYSSLLRAYPDDIDGWYQYGELLFHQGLYLGRALSAAEDPFRRVIALQPDHQAALAHLMRIAARTGRLALVDSLGKQIDRITPNMERTPEVPLLRAYALHDTAAIERNIAAINQQPDYPVWVTAWRIAAYSGDMNGALRVIRSDMRAERGQQYRAAAQLSAAHFEAARGRFRAADSLTLAAAALDPEGALRTRAFLAALPFAPVNGRVLGELRRSLNETEKPFELPGGPLRAHLSNPHLRILLLSLLAARAGDVAAAQSWRVAAHAEPGDSTLGASFDHTMRGAIAAAGNDVAEKKAALDAWSTQPQSLHDTPRSAGFTYAFENYMRAQLYEQLGRYTEALAWYDALGNDFAYDVGFFAPAALRRARLLENRGERDAAVREYSRFITLWKDADPELQPQVAAARERLRSLGVR
jgi:tetratricopeptide (TPR) repeat protein